MLAKDCLEEFKVECDLRRLSPRTTKVYYNNTALFLNYLEKHEKLTQLEALISQRFIGEVDETAIEDAAADAMVQALGDPWSYYIPAD